MCKVIIDGFDETKDKLYPEFIDDNERKLLGDDNEYKAELFKYCNISSKVRIDKILLSLTESIKRFKYDFDDIYAELSSIPDYALIYYSRYIFYLVCTYQNEDFVNKIFNFLNGKRQNYLLIDDYRNYNSNKISNKKTVTISDKVLHFWDTFKSVYKYNVELFFNELDNKKLLPEIINYINSDDMQGLLTFSYDNGLYDLFFYIYTHFDVIFDFKYIEPNRISSGDNGRMTVCKTSEGGKLGLTFEIHKSKKQMDIIKGLLHIRRYSQRIEKERYKFNKKYLSCM
jgi:hypothetical protein